MSLLASNSFRLLRSLQRAGHAWASQADQTAPYAALENATRALGAPPKPLVVHAVCYYNEAVAAVCGSVMKQRAESAMRSRDAVTSGEPHKNRFQMQIPNGRDILLFQQRRHRRRFL